MIHICHKLDHALLRVVKFSLGGTEALPGIRDPSANRIERCQIATLLWGSYFMLGGIFAGATAVAHALLGGWSALPFAVLGCVALGRGVAVGVTGQQLQKREASTQQVEDLVTLIFATVFFIFFLIARMG